MYYYKAIKNIDIVFCIKKNINNNDFYFLLAPVTKQIKKSNTYFQIKVLIYVERSSVLPFYCRGKEVLARSIIKRLIH